MLTTLLALALSIAPPVDEVARTPPPTAAVAQVILVGGQPTALVKGGAKPILLARGMLLDREDQVKTPDGGWVALVLLRNGLAVRIDEALEMRVSELAVFDAPAQSGVNLENELDRLLTRKERGGFGDRLIGFKAGLAAASTLNTKGADQANPETSTKARELAKEEPSAGAGARPAPAPKKTVAPASAPSVEIGPQALLPRPEEKADVVRTVRPPSRAGGAAATSKKKEEGGLEDRRSGEPVLAPDRALRVCLADVVAKLGPAGRSALRGPIEIRARLVGNELELRLKNALPPPDCARQWFEARRPSLSETWTNLSVPLE